MGLAVSAMRALYRAAASGSQGTASSSSSSLSLPTGIFPSLFQARVAELAADCLRSPLEESLEVTLRRCIAFCYFVTPEWAPHVRVTVFADNPSEHQLNVPVYDALLVTWGVPGSSSTKVTCKPIAGTDVQRGVVVANPYWQRRVRVEAGQVHQRTLIHRLLHWFVELDDSDPRKQMLVNIILQLHEACFNCIGRHKEVFEYCVYDLLEAEALGPPSSSPESKAGVPAVHAALGDEVQRARRAVCRHANAFLDRHKRDALHSAVLSPLKFLFQHIYEVFENLDSHGASFWSAVFQEVFFPGLQLPYESIVELDKGWTWAASDFLPLMQFGPGKTALDRFSAVDNLGLDWRTVARGLRPPAGHRRLLPGLPGYSVEDFRYALEAAKRPGTALHRSLVPYAERFASFFTEEVLLRRWALQAVASPRWDNELGPALSSLSEEAWGTKLRAEEVRDRLCDCSGVDIKVDSSAACALLGAAGVSWAPAPKEPEVARTKRD